MITLGDLHFVPEPAKRFCEAYPDPAAPSWQDWPVVVFIPKYKAYLPQMIALIEAEERATREQRDEAKRLAEVTLLTIEGQLAARGW